MPGRSRRRQGALPAHRRGPGAPRRRADGPRRSAGRAAPARRRQVSLWFFLCLLEFLDLAHLLFPQPSPSILVDFRTFSFRTSQSQRELLEQVRARQEAEERTNQMARALDEKEEQLMRLRHEVRLRSDSRKKNSKNLVRRTGRFPIP